MDYRDDREALRGRVENLEQDLAGAREEIDKAGGERRRIEEIERQMAEARRVLDQLDGQLGELRGGAKSRRSVGRLALLLGGAFAIAALGGIFLLRAPAAPAEQAVVAPVQRVPVRALPAVPSPPPDPPRVDPPPRARETAGIAARWTATVTHATGLALGPGSSCTIEATLESRGGDIDVPTLRVVCGGKPVYSSADPLNGVSMSSTGVSEEAGAKEGSYVYALKFEDKGERSGERAQVSINTPAKAGSVWNDSAPAYRVDFVAAQKSVAVDGGPLLDATAKAMQKGK